ncbi:replication initiator protein A [Streptococcus equi]|uniref:IFN-response binding factor 1 n=1 Tax=Streptococcus equi subsp. zooepidemicus TaxID=40041 RepID=A0A7Z8ZUW4_STRSZ|nr:replication initiator protein A [Streptococcus equi]MCD3401597.1 replication initiator protein A [Streptococcus equi subsp. zooepidemicus]VEF04866.1 IFN-response binding factor 1 [Streptococcus equi subsp. zooepidemicus]HEL0020794.1 replication initiator protein A [Streptococcus equi subsp. zooepidemicus]HEL0676065.1 replication initiator protein A [Streptococcus equi subsp. zooepidemicus]HEL1241332.1 replication initiator protein A [Streptococcus equi subsp. zooepidemicus]
MAYGRISLEQALNSDNFYQLPKVVIKSKYYRKLKAEAKLMFMLCRDRLSASLDSTRKGDLRFVDDLGDIFIYYNIEELSEDLGCGRDKVMKLKRELIKYGLIDEVRQGLNKANRIYVKNALTDIQILNMEFEEAQLLLKPVKSTEVGKSDFRKSENQTSRSRKIRLQEVEKSDSTYTKESEIKESNNKVSHFDDDEEIVSQIFEEEKVYSAISRKVDKATKYDREYIYELVHDQLLKENFSQTSADYAMIHFDTRYQYALENMRFAHSSEVIAEYVFNGILAEMNQVMRKEQNKGVG